MRNISCAVFAILLTGPAALCQELLRQEPKLNHLLYTSPRRTFTCEIPKEWQSFEEETAQGSAVHISTSARNSSTCSAPSRCWDTSKASAMWTPRRYIL